MSAVMRDDVGRLLMRMSLAILMLFHGVAKITSGVAPIEIMLQARGLPPDLAILVLIGEVVAPVLLILGVWTVPAAVLIAFTMVVAVWLAHPGHLFRLTPHGGWALELQAFYFLNALAVALLGPGRYALSARKSVGPVPH